MAWVSRVPAVSLTEGGVLTDYASLTTTSTLALDESGSARLRMYMYPNSSTTGPMTSGIDPSYRILVDANNVLNAGLDKAQGENQYIAYLDSASDGQFALEKATHQLPQTWIAQVKSFSSWIVRTTARRDFYCDGLATYDDPNVVPIPETLGGGYLMLLTRKRQITSGIDVVEGAGEASQRLADIVAFRSDNPEFNDPAVLAGTTPVPLPRAVRGPVLLVDGAEALPDVSFRVFVGVPTAVFRTNPDTGDVSLYVYYAVDFPTNAYITQERPGYRLKSRASEYIVYLDAEQGFIGCKRFDWNTLKRAFVLPTPEGKWTSAEEGDLLGRVRVWVPQFMPGVTRVAREILLVYRDEVKRITDPEAERIGGISLSRALEDVGGDQVGDQLPGQTGGADYAARYSGPVSLYFRAVNRTDPADWRDGHGLWRASSIPDGTILQCYDSDASIGAIRNCVFGIDFVVKRPPDSFKSRDMVAPGGSPLSKDNPQDPDVVLVTLETGVQQWWVYAGFFGFSQPTGSSVTGAPLGWVVGDYEDGVWTWQSAWGFP